MRTQFPVAMLSYNDLRRTADLLAILNTSFELWMKPRLVRQIACQEKSYL